MKQTFTQPVNINSAALAFVNSYAHSDYLNEPKRSEKTV